jgi:hypothetical protein
MVGISPSPDPVLDISPQFFRCLLLCKDGQREAGGYNRTNILILGVGMKSDRKFKYHRYEGRIEKETKFKAYQELVDWILENAHKYHIVKIHKEEGEEAYRITFRYIKKNK